MPQINIHKNPLAYNPEVINLAAGSHLIQALAENVSWVGSADTIVVKRNGEVIGSSIHHDLNEVCDFELTVFDQVDVYAVPQGLEISLATALLISAGIAAATFLLLPTPNMPNDAGSQKSSPTNQGSSSTNEYRKNQAEAEVYGRVRIIPDFNQPSYYEYIDNKRVFTEIFSMGIGYFDIHEVYTEEQKFSSLNNSGYEYLPPMSPARSYKRALSANEADGQEVFAQNDPAFSNSFANATLTEDSISGSDIEDIINDLQVEVGNNLQLDCDYLDLETGVARSMSGTFEVASLGVDEIFFVNPNFVPSQSGSASGIIINDSENELEPWIVTRGDDTEEVWFQVFMPRGIRSSTQGFLRIEFRAEVQQIDGQGEPIGTIIDKDVFIEGNTPDAQYRTFKIEMLTPGRYRARIRRITGKQPEAAADSVKLEDIQSVINYEKQYEETSTLIIERRGSIQPSGGRQSKINVDATRKLELFNPTTGLFDTGNYTATRSYAQAVMDTLRRANESIENIDYISLFNIENSLTQPELGYFDFSFDDADVSVGQRIETICNAARVRYYKALGTIWSFVRDEAKPMAVKYFNRRNIHGDLTISRKHYIRDAFDSIELKWVDPITNDERFERRRINATTGVIETGVGVRPQEITLAGCRNEIQAVNRIELEIRKLKYSRYNLSGTFSAEALTVGPLNKIAIGDINDTETFDGEITEVDEVNGLYLTTEPFEPEAGKNYFTMISEVDGDVGVAVTVTAHPSTKMGFSAPALSGAVEADGYNIQIGSRYLIATEDDIDRSYFSVLKRGSPDSLGRTPVEATEYNDKFYELD